MPSSDGFVGGKLESKRGRSSCAVSGVEMKWITALLMLEYWRFEDGVGSRFAFDFWLQIGCDEVAHLGCFAYEDDGYRRRHERCVVQSLIFMI